jgi:ribonucleoside-diphosphate reductase alpha chain
LSPLDQPICVDIWRDKYAYRGEATYEDTCRRVASALCGGDRKFQHDILEAMKAREIVPAGRILAGAGTDKRVTLINCFTSPLIQDSMATNSDCPGAGIMDALSKAAYTQQMGGGIGMDFSTIRPRGAKVFRTGSVSSGVLPFMDMWDAMCATIRSSGDRRGAMMATLGIWHPDIEDFVAAKQTPGRLTNFNVSVLVPDAFMRAVEKDGWWDLHFPSAPERGGMQVWGSFPVLPDGTYVYRQVRARELWNKITEATYIHAEPGVIFIDRVNALNNLAYCEHIHCTNPCGEQPLPANGDCNLGHVNLAVMVDHPFESGASFNWGKLKWVVAIMVRLLDNVLDVTLWPLEEQGIEARNKRRIGLGFTGLASALQQLGIAYGSKEAVVFTRAVAQMQAIEAYKASCALAKERGPFPLYDDAKFRAAPFVRKLVEDAKVDLDLSHGIRNGVLLSIAPTGTTSLAVGNVSSGIEPVFSHHYRRKVRGFNGEMDREYSVYDYGYLKYCEQFGVEADHAYRTGKGAHQLPAGFITADQLTVEQHLQMAAAAQEWVDAAISKTINCPTSMSLEDFRAVYDRAYALGMKGCTTYRPDPRSKRGAVLEVAATPPANVAAVEVTERIGEISHTERTEFREVQEVAEGDRHRIKGVRETVVDVEVRAQDEVTVHVGDILKVAGTDTGGVEVKVERVSVVNPIHDKLPMQEVAEGKRYRIKWPHEDCAYYLIITDCVDHAGRRRPFELFISTKSERHSEWVKAFSLLVTAIFRRESDPTFVIDELRSVFAATGGSWVRVPWSAKPKLATSLVAAIGLKIEEHVRGLGMIEADESFVPAPAPVAEPASTMPATEIYDVCDHCGARAVIYQEGCAECRACGRSDCG